MLRKIFIMIILLIPSSAYCVSPTTGNSSARIGCTTAFSIDEDCDGYGIGVGYVLGPDADDHDATVNTTETVSAKYGSVSNGSSATIITNLKAFFKSSRGYSNIGDIFFVSPTGDDSTGAPNDPTKPFRYFGFTSAGGVKKHPAFGPGDMILYKGGIYNTNLSMQQRDQIDVQYSTPIGTSSAPIIFASFPGELAEFSADIRGIGGVNSTVKDLWYVFDTFQIGTPNASTSDNGIVLTGAREVKFRNIEVLRKGGNGIKLMSNVVWPNTQIPLKNVLIEKCVVSRTDGSIGTSEHNIYIGHAVPKSANNPATGLLIRNIISHSNQVFFDGMQINGHFDNWAVERSQFHSNSGWGVAFLNGPSKGRFTGNEVYNNNTSGIKIGKYIGFVGNNTPSAESNVENNKWLDNIVWVGDLFNGNGPTDGRDPSNWNAIYFYTESTCETSPIDKTTVCPDYTTSHNGNIFYNNILVTHGSSPIRADQRSHLENNTFLNNFMYRTDGKQTVANLKSNTESWSLAQFEADIRINAKDNLNKDPKFRDVRIEYANDPKKFNFSVIRPSSTLLDVVK